MGSQHGPGREGFFPPAPLSSTRGRLLAMKRIFECLRSMGKVLGIILLAWGCAYRFQAGLLYPATEQSERMQVADDGTITYVYQRLEVGLRPMSDEELNREFASYSQAGRESLNPYTYGNWKPRAEEVPPPRFTVFRLSVKNYTYPKIHLDPDQMSLTTQNGRLYFPLTFEYLKEYYAPYNVGWMGVSTKDYKERKDLLKRTLYPKDEFVFSGQERVGYVVFPLLSDDVEQIQVAIADLSLRFDAWNKPVEITDLSYQFQREVIRRDRGPLERKAEVK